MPFFRKRTEEFPAIKFTGDNYKVVETWGTAFGVKVCQFLTEPDVPYVAFEDGEGDWYWVRLEPGAYLARPFRGQHFIQEALPFEDTYEEVV